MGGSETSLDVSSEDNGSGLYCCPDDSDDSDLEGCSVDGYVQNTYGSAIAFEEWDVDVPSDSETDDLVATELGVAFRESLQLTGVDAEIEGSYSASGLNCEEDSVLSVPLNSKPSNDDVAEPDHGDDVLSSSVLIPGSRSNDAASLRSAMKGSRAERGIILETKLSVKWAPDVYDPPVTSDCHTLKGHQQLRPKAHRKDYHKQKSSSKSSSRDYRNKKDKPSHRSSSSSSSRRNKSVDPRVSSSQAAYAKAGKAGKYALPMENDDILVPVTENAKELKYSSSIIGHHHMSRLQAEQKVDRMVVKPGKELKCSSSRSRSTFCMDHRLPSLRFSLAEAS